MCSRTHAAALIALGSEYYKRNMFDGVIYSGRGNV